MAIYPPGNNQVNVNAGDPGYVATGAGPLYYARRVFSLLFGVAAVLLLLRIVLLMFAANEGNVIVDFVYGATEPLVAPFRGVFNFDVVTPNGSNLFDVAALVAFFGWSLIYLLIMAILSLTDRNREAVV